MATALSTGGSYITGGTVTVSGSTSDSELTIIYGTRNSSGTTTVGTVGAGKVWRIYAIGHFFEPCLSAGQDFTSDLMIDGNIISRLNVVSNLTGSAYGLAAQTPSMIINFGGSKYIALAATKTITMTNDTTNYAKCWVAYQEVDA